MYSGVIGILGVIIGTVLGWLLNVASNSGKIDIQIRSIKISFYIEIGESGGMFNPSTFANSTHINCTIDTSIYNASSISKIMRNPQIAFYDKKSIVEKFNVRHFVHNEAPHMRYPDLTHLNLEPKKINDFEFLTRFCSLALDDEKKKKILKANAIYLVYKNDNNRTKKIKILKYNDLAELNLKA